MARPASGSPAYRRAGIAVAVIASFVTVWTTVVRDDGNGIGFFMVIMAVAVGWFAAGFRAAGMARTMVGVAVMQAMVGMLSRLRRRRQTCRAVPKALLFKRRLCTAVDGVGRVLPRRREGRSLGVRVLRRGSRRR